MRFGKGGGGGGGRIYSRVYRKPYTLTVLPLLDSCCSTQAPQPEDHPICPALWVDHSFQSYDQVRKSYLMKYKHTQVCYIFSVSYVEDFFGNSYGKRLTFVHLAGGRIHLGGSEGR